MLNHYKLNKYYKYRYEEELRMKKLKTNFTQVENMNSSDEIQSSESNNEFKTMDIDKNIFMTPPPNDQ